MWEIEEEWAGSGCRVDELHGFVRIPLREAVEVGGLLYDILVAHQHSGHHVVAIGNAEVLIEAAPCRQIFGCGAEMPLADAFCFVPTRLQQICERLLIEVESGLVLREKYFRHADSGWIASCEQRCARG